MSLRTVLHGDREIKLKKVITPKHLANFGKSLTKVNKDLPILITGYPGEGKSVLAKFIGESYDKRFNYDRNYIYSRKELIEKIEAYPPSAFVVDEAINVLYKREWNKSSQKELVKVMNICRSKKHMIIFVQPNFTDMDKDIRNERLRLWVFVIKRGIAAVMKPARSFGGTADPWNLDTNDAIIKKYVKKDGDFLGTIEGVYRTENFLNFMRWEDIDKDEYDIYEKVKDDKKYAEEDVKLLTPQDADKHARNKIFDLLAILRNKSLIKKGSYNYIASYLGIGASAVSGYMKKAEAALNMNQPEEQEDGLTLD